MVGEPLSTVSNKEMQLFQSRCRDWVVGEFFCEFLLYLISCVSVSLPRLGGWRAATPTATAPPTPRFSLVAEIGWLASGRCLGIAPCPSGFSLVAEIGWLASCSARTTFSASPCFSLVAEIGWLASISASNRTISWHLFQSRCRDWVVGESNNGCPNIWPCSFQSRCRDWVVGERESIA